MPYIDPRIRMVSRTTDDAKRMALAGYVMVSEPAFWAGFDRSGPEGFRDYFRLHRRDLRSDRPLHTFCEESQLLGSNPV